jgi:integrase
LADGANLYLEATLSADGSSVNRSWVFRYQLNHERHELGLGPVYTIGLAAAREQAKQHRQQILAGIDPLHARREAERERLRAKATRANAVTFKECAEMYLRVHSNKWRNAKHAQWAETVKIYVFPALGDLAVADISVGHVVQVLEPIWKRINQTARRLRGRIETILTYATAAGFRSGDNPASWNVLQHLLGGKAAAQLPALPFMEVSAFFRELQDKKSASCRALAFAILTAARTGEVLGATWDEIDLRANVWTIPAARMKAGKEHRIPLSDTAVALLNALPRYGTYVFGRHGKPFNDKALRVALSALRANVTVHGFRSTFRDWAAERTASCRRNGPSSFPRAQACKIGRRAPVVISTRNSTLITTIY